MSYRVLSTRMKSVTSEAPATLSGESRAFSALTEAMAWASQSRRGDCAVVLVEELNDRSVTVRSPEEAARIVV